YIALDIFVCGSRDPHKALNVLRTVFRPGKERIVECQRGARE
ncbi:MAG: adenosylmethionine decarboxylase, partial [Bacteroidetes bacterium]|nr:adenosylmethionine decarboxylase [Bacteroidota bacterium]